MIHPRAWVGWLVAAIVTLSVTRNPLYLALILACIAAVIATLRPVSKAPPLPMSPLRLGLIIVVISALFNGLTAHFGDTVLFTLPAALPLVGGPVTLEALAFGALNGLALAGFLAAFTVLNLALPTQALIRLIPRAFYPVAVVLSIAIAFVPNTLSQFQQIREAQAVRGHRVRGLRDWLPLLLPLLVGGLERAMQLAEAMTARGYASSLAPAGGRAGSPLSRLGLVAGLALLLAGLLLRLVRGQQATGMAALLAGGLLILAALWLAGRQVTRSVYRPQPWTARDGLALLAAAAVTTAYLVPLPGLDRTALFYTPYPALARPPLDVALALVTMGLITPAALLRLPTPLR